ncbi:recombinase family protein [Cryobacterium sinapicolor]|uniref:Recombinase family protein n=1 Tax=Cryobacterium sinapicolor TaxID=1259236 RepID=A0ABY2ITX9_9MICO|nr:recombinase family protein [Cryobacterium sinapicolor]TFC94564.1 recombinase family protein [Cryobacterium sinapicolor]
MTLRAAVYTRISERDEKVDKVDIQERRLRALATTEGYSVVEVYSDDGISAYSGKSRPAFLRLLDALKLDKFDIILAVAEDRFARNSGEKVGLMSDCVRHGVTWHTLAGGPVDPSTASGGMLSTITGAIAEYESAIKVERLRARFADRLAEGKPLWGVRPFGFKLDRIEAEETEAAHVRAAFDVLLNGGTLYSVQKALNDSGVLTTRGNKWSYQTVRQMVLRPRNAGLLVSKGELMAEGLPAIVTADELEQVTAILANPTRETTPGPKVTKHFATGLVTCGVCGSPMRSASARSRGRVLPIYKCSRKMAVQGHGETHPTIQRDILEAAIPAEVYFALQALARNGGNLSTEKAATLGPLRAGRAELDRQRTVAQEIALMPGANLATLRKTLATIEQQVEAIDAKLTAAMRSTAQAAVIENVAGMVAIFSAIDDEGRAPTSDEWALQFGSGRLFLDQWAGLGIEDRRALIRTTLAITVNPAATAEKVAPFRHPSIEPEVIRAGRKRIEFTRIEAGR